MLQTWFCHGELSLFTVTAATLQLWPLRNSTEESRGTVPCSKATQKLLWIFHQRYISVKSAEDVTSTEQMWSSEACWGSVLLKGPPLQTLVVALWCLQGHTASTQMDGNHSTVKYIPPRHFFTLALNVSLAPELCLTAHTAYCWSWRSQHPGAERHVYCTEQEHINLVDGMRYQYMKTDTLAHSPTLGRTIALIFLLTSIFRLWFLCVT